MTEASWSDPRILPAEQCVLSAVLQRRAAAQPDAPFAHFEDGSAWTFAQALAQTRRTAAALQRLGVKAGDHVNVCLPNDADAVRVWFAINWLGAVFVPVNLAYRGHMLEHVVADARASVIVMQADLVQRLAEIARAALRDVVVSGTDAQAVEGLRQHDLAALVEAEAEDAAPPAAPVRPWDTQMVIYTSGTTGPSKGVLMSYQHVVTASSSTWPYLDASDRFLVNLPLFHVSGVGGVVMPLLLGGSFAMVRGFSTADFWQVVRRTRSTSVVLLGVMASFLLKQPPAPGDREHTLRTVTMVPLSEDAQAFSQRFGCDVHTVFNMTEVSSPLRAGPNPAPVSTCGRPRPGVEVRLVDASDCEVPLGSTGELVVRCDSPWAMNSGYLNNPAATASAWRNGWFHTGDAFRVDEQGNYFFVDRMKDAIRRRGENISSFEVETEVCAHPAVQEAAAVAVPSEFGEDEVLVVLALKPGASFDAAEFLGFLARRMPQFMVPRYVRVLKVLPKTPTLKVQKHLLRSAGLTPDTVDAQTLGLGPSRRAQG